MFITQKMSDIVLRSIPEKGIYHFDVVFQEMINNIEGPLTLQNVIVGTIIVKIRNGEISTYECPCDYINDQLGGLKIMNLGKELAINRAQEIEKFITE